MQGLLRDKKSRSPYTVWKGIGKKKARYPPCLFFACGLHPLIQCVALRLQTLRGEQTHSRVDSFNG